MYNDIAAVGQSIQIQADYTRLSTTSVSSDGSGVAFDAQAFSLELSMDSQVGLFAGQFNEDSKAEEFVKALVLLMLWQMQTNEILNLLADASEFLSLVSSNLEESGMPGAASQAQLASNMVDSSLAEHLDAGQWPADLPMEILTESSGGTLAPATSDTGTGGIDVIA